LSFTLGYVIPSQIVAVDVFIPTEREIRFFLWLFWYIKHEVTLVFFNRGV